MSDIRIKRRVGKPKRSDEELIEHYRVEKELASKLRSANAAERKTLYTRLYDEVFQRVPHHPQLERKIDSDRQRRRTEKQLRRIEKFLTPSSVFLEVGPGDCHLAMEVAKRVKKVYAVDVSDEITRVEKLPCNLELIISDGSSVEVEPSSVDVAYSNQLMEHLHPDDAAKQVRAIVRALKPGGLYICITPHRFMGPFDISRYFDDIATGFHLKEYTNAEIARLFRDAGFSTVGSLRHISTLYFTAPLGPVLFLEALLSLLPFALRRAIAKGLIFKDILSLAVVARKGV